MVPQFFTHSIQNQELFWIENRYEIELEILEY